MRDALAEIVAALVVAAMAAVPIAVVALCARAVLWALGIV